MQASVCLLIVLVSLIITSCLGCTNSEFSLRDPHPVWQTDTEVRSPNGLQRQVRGPSIYVSQFSLGWFLPDTFTLVHLLWTKHTWNSVLRTNRQWTVAWVVSAYLAFRTLWIQSPPPQRYEIPIILGYIVSLKMTSLYYMSPCLKTWKINKNKKLMDTIKLIWSYSIPLYVFCGEVLLGTFSVYHP